jgi:hypothetical protein
MEKPLGHPHDQGFTIAKRAVHPIFKYMGKVIPSMIGPVLVIHAANLAAQMACNPTAEGCQPGTLRHHLLEVAALVAAGGGDQRPSSPPRYTAAKEMGLSARRHRAMARIG